MKASITKQISWGILLLALLAAGCYGTLTPKPIDVEKLPPEQQEIVTQARNFLGMSRLAWQTSPQVMLVRRKGSAWEVMFEGEMRLIPPGFNTQTPTPLTHQCAHVLIDPITHRNSLSSGPCRK